MRYRPFDRGREGFTLIELLIVIAIILILIAIALPNFLEAQIRARVTKAKGEIRSLSIAMESYHLDFNIYPSESESNILSPSWTRFNRGHFWLTSPITYITSIPEDPFTALHPEDGAYGTYESGGIEPNASLHPMGRKCSACMLTWALWSKGPNVTQVISGDNAHQGGDDVRNYSPTNGTTSRGAIVNWGGDPLWIGFRGTTAIVSQLTTLPPSPCVVDGTPYIRKLPPKL